MCESFKQQFFNQISEKVKSDTFALDILRNNHDMTINECPFNLKGCKKYYVELGRSKDGFSCTQCNATMCSSCKKFKTIENLCMECFIIIRGRGDSSICQMNCPECNGHLKCVLWSDDMFCSKCKIIVCKKDAQIVEEGPFYLMSSNEKIQNVLSTSNNIHKDEERWINPTLYFDIESDIESDYEVH